jgi:hypothetical protein
LPYLTKMNIYELFYKIIEDPRCIKYYKDLAKYYEKTNNEKKNLYEKIINKYENSNNNSNKKQ